jgi:murein DD-endopeptidase MepM/ murein hydrolase activator NlpD
MGIIGALVWMIGSLDRQGPVIQLTPELQTLGAKNTLNLTVADEGSGLQEVQAVLRQGEVEKEILRQSLPSQGWFKGSKEHKLEIPLTFDLRTLGLKDGAAELAITARDYSFWGKFGGNKSSLKRSFTIDLMPLRLTFLSINQFLNQGGTGLMVYQVNKPLQKSGALVDGSFFPGYPLPGKAGHYLVLFAVPYEGSKPLSLELVAVDQGGIETKTRVAYRFHPQRWRRDKLKLAESFFNQKMPEFQEMYPDLRSLSDPVEVFLKVNREWRVVNNRKVEEICQHSNPERLWEGAFIRLPNSKPMARFADHRTYLFKGKEIDQQVHLGQDMASLKMAAVPAGNNGIVVFTGPLGIYGNTVFLDHGWGLFSMYSHLSQISVEKGQKVLKGAVLGRTGTTGMAGGDHLHFGMMIQGKFINPLEWLDPHWIKDQVNRQLTLTAAAVPGTAGAAPAPPPKGKGKRRR